jgi:ribonucleoside-diphosphate reductase alpha chain
MITQEVSVVTPTGKKIYSQEEAIQASLVYFKGDDLAARVWVNKYALKDSFGNVFELTPDDMHRRLASEIARVEKITPTLYQKKRFTKPSKILNTLYRRAGQ